MSVFVVGVSKWPENLKFANETAQKSLDTFYQQEKNENIH